MQPDAHPRRARCSSHYLSVLALRVDRLSEMDVRMIHGVTVVVHNQPLYDRVRLVLTALSEVATVDAFIDEYGMHPAIDTVQIDAVHAHHVYGLCTRLYMLFPAIKHLHICCGDSELDLVAPLAIVARLLIHLSLTAGISVLPVMPANCELDLNYGLETASPRYIENNTSCMTSDTLGPISRLTMAEMHIASVDLSHSNMQRLEMEHIVTLKSVKTSAPVCLHCIHHQICILLTRLVFVTCICLIYRKLTIV